MVSAGPTFWPLDQTPQVMKAYREFITWVPEAGRERLLRLPDRAARALVPGEPASPPENLHHQKMCAIIWCSTAAPEKADQATKAMRSVGQPALDHVEPMPFPALQSLFGGFYPPGLQWYWRADFFKEISDASIAPHLKYAGQLPIGHSTMHMYPINGAAQRVGYSDTAFSYRDALLAGVIVGVDPDPNNKEEDHQLNQGVLRRSAPAFIRRCLRQLHDEGGPGAREDVLPRQLRSLGDHTRGSTTPRISSA